MRPFSSIAALVLLVSVSFSGAETTTPPNVLFISIDDLNDMPRFMGRYPDALTPHMDRIAARGISFSRAHTPYPLCGPARASVMTSTLATTHGFHSHTGDREVKARGREMGTSTLPELFKSHGYHVMAVGKLFHNHVPPGTVDESGARGKWDQHPKGRQNFKSNKTLTDWAYWPRKEEDMADAQAADWASERLAKEYEQPFLMMVGFIRPHVPWIVPDRYFDLYPEPGKLTMPPYKPDDLDDVPKRSRFLNIATEMPNTGMLIRKKQWNEVIHAYLASCSFVDHHLGRVLDALESGPEADNTLIVLWSDHGYHLGEKGSFQKHSLWERSSHVPLVFAGPGIEPKQVCGRPVSLIDLLPTLAELCGLPAMQAWEGRSLAPLIENPEKEWPHPVITTWQGRNYAIQTESHRYLIYDDGSEELYDHQDDLDEWHNLAEQSEFTPLKTELRGYVPETYEERVPGKLQNGARTKGK